MKQKEQHTTVDTTMSYLTLRKLLGGLGILLPLFLLIGTGFETQSSISHFYYTKSSVVFTSVLFAFGLFLFSYRGRLKETEFFSDNFLTNIGGFLAILTALIPTAVCQNECCDTVSITNELVNLCCKKGIATQYIHNDSWRGIIHLGCAAGFLALMGWVSFDRFTNGDNITKGKKFFYRFCGVGVWVSLISIGVGIFLKKNFTGIDVFIGEWIALFFFGIAWLVKGKALKKFGI
jgi:hypothetical protein